MKNIKEFWAHMIALITIIVWSSTFIASKYMLELFSPLQVMIMRFTIAYVVLWLMKPSFTKFVWKDEWLFLLMGLSGCTAYFITENTALTITSTANVSILVALSSILTALLSHIFNKDEKMKLTTILGFIVAFFGVALVVFNGAFVLKLNPFGDALAFLSALSWAFYSLILRKVVNRYHGIILIRKVMFYGSITTLPFLLIENKPFNFAALAEPKILISLFFLGVFGSAICYVVWNISVKSLGIVKTNSYIYVIPFVAMLLAALLLDESITILGIAGAILIIMGVVITTNPKNLFKKRVKNQPAS